MNMMLLEADKLRYQRQLPLLGIKGQAALKQSKLACVGAGGLGSTVLPYLAACGVGHLTIIDGDRVELSNLQRQVIYSETDIGRFKTEAAKAHLSALNASIRVDAHARFLDGDNCEDLLAGHDVIIDASDNFNTRYLVNDYCRAQDIPLVSASILGFEGQLSVYNFQGGPCYECLFPEESANLAHASPNCAQAGVLGVLPGLLGVLQATETIKIITSQGKPLSGILLAVDALSMEFKHYRIDKRPNCHRESCQGSHYKKVEASETMVQVPTITVEELSVKLKTQAITLLDVREAQERAICHLEGPFIPLRELPGRIEELDKHGTIVVYCKLGGRSHQAAMYLLSQGFEHVYNLAGGIIDWIDRIDRSLARY